MTGRWYTQDHIDVVRSAGELVGMDGEATTVYEAVGGMAFFEALVERFYAGVARDEVLRPMYPEDLSAPRRHLALFLAQYWGGPSAYSDERGHPRLRMRHAPFVVDEVARDHWLEHMRAALAELAPPPELARQLDEYLEYAAGAMINAI
jgi:hemoglobin